jgi:pyruvate formate-lyase activating enzyme-like uncharacterized protein
MREALSTSTDLSLFLQIKRSFVFFKQPAGSLLVLSYRLPSSINDFSQYKGESLKNNWKKGVWMKDDFLNIVYFTGTNQNYYGNLEISWKCGSQKSELNIESIVAIITVSVVLFLCCSCCVFCCFKFSRAWRLRNRRRTQARSRIYQVIPENSLIQISDENLNQVLPVIKYEKSLQEVGEPACPICFDE